MNARLHISQSFSHSVMVVLACLCLLLLPASLYAQSQKPSLPDPIKFINKFDIVWNVVKAIFSDMGYNVELEDRKGGRIVSRPYEFIAGSLTASEVDKVAIKTDSVTGNWLRARYSVEALLEIVTPAETMLTIRTRMEGLKREMDGSEKWMPLESLGVIEKRILGKISMKLLGNEMQFDNKKGFWDKSPQPINRGTKRPYTSPPPR